MIVTLKIDLESGMYAESSWQVVLEVEDTTTLTDLHDLIQEAVGFDDDHMYEFFVARTRRSRDRQHFDDENGLMDTTCVTDMFPLKKGRKLFYWFDYGDDWIFRVAKTRRQPFEPEAGVRYPRLVKEEGERPEQYPSIDW